MMMKMPCTVKLFCFLFSLALCCFSPLSACADRSMTIRFTAQCGEEDFNHVGNEWIFGFTINGVSYAPSNAVVLESRESASGTITTLVLSEGSTLDISVEITEMDPKLNDYGSDEVHHTVTASDLANGFSLSLQADVTEDGGRYKGRSCTWNITLSF